jgi:hypothetical protein
MIVSETTLPSRTHCATIRRAREHPDQGRRSSYGFTWECFDCAARGRRVFPSDRWRTRKEKESQEAGNILRMPSALEAASDHERNARYGPNRGKRLAKALGVPVTELLG